MNTAASCVFIISLVLINSSGITAFPSDALSAQEFDLLYDDLAWNLGAEMMQRLKRSVTQVSCNATRMCAWVERGVQ